MKNNHLKCYTNDEDKFQDRTTTMGFEPTTFGSEVQRANPLRYAVILWIVSNKITNIII